MKTHSFKFSYGAGARIAGRALPFFVSDKHREDQQSLVPEILQVISVKLDSFQPDGRLLGCGAVDVECLNL